MLPLELTSTWLFFRKCLRKCFRKSIATKNFKHLNIPVILSLQYKINEIKILKIFNLPKLTGDSRSNFILTVFSEKVSSHSNFQDLILQPRNHKLHTIQYKVICNRKLYAIQSHIITP